MKKLITVLLLLNALTALSRPVTDSTKMLLYRARYLANPKSPTYQPLQAFNIFHKLALQGNGEAMNGLALLYSKGIGITQDDREALTWLEQSVKAGYAGAYYNLALAYKDGLGVPQSFTKAYELYGKGAVLNNPKCIYGKGYMLYKGYGVAQNYEEAVTLFKRGALLRDEGSYYMLGLSYRNGYGTLVNIDSARYWLKKAASFGDTRAINELADASSENADLKNIPNLPPSMSEGSRPVDLKSGFKQIAHHVVKSDIAGDYTGYVIKFDWSGKHIIGQSDLKVHLERKEKILTGEWKEDGQELISISGFLTDTALIFNNTSYNQVDHYHKNQPLTTLFKDSHLNLVKNKDTVYLSGTLHKLSTKFKEPEKPEFILLIRTTRKQSDVVTDTVLNYTANAKADSVHFVAYPNPFTSNLKLRYTLKKTMQISIFVSNLQTGQIVYRSQALQLAKGDYDGPVYFNGQPGNYIVTLQYGKKVKSLMVFKQ